MRRFWVYDIDVAENYFEINLINPENNRQEVCYVLNGKPYNTGILQPLLCNCLMIGDGNHSYGDIILNYIWYNKEIVPKEIYELSRAINDNSVDDYGYFMNLGIDSIDLSKLSDYEELKEEWKSKLPFKIKGVDVIAYYLQVMANSLTKRYKTSLQFRRDLTRAALTPKGREEFDNFIFYYNVNEKYI